MQVVSLQRRSNQRLKAVLDELVDTLVGDDVVQADDADDRTEEAPRNADGPPENTGHNAEEDHFRPMPPSALQEVSTA